MGKSGLELGGKIQPSSSAHSMTLLKMYSILRQPSIYSEWMDGLGCLRNLLCFGQTWSKSHHFILYCWFFDSALACVSDSELTIIISTVVLGLGKGAPPFSNLLFLVNLPFCELFFLPPSDAELYLAVYYLYFAQYWPCLFLLPIRQCPLLYDLCHTFCMLLLLLLC